MLKIHNNDERTEFLGTVSLFEGLRRKQLRRVASLTTGIVVPAGHVLCEKGKRGDEFFVIRSGEVEVSTGATLGAGDFFGEMALLMDAPRSATVVATVPTYLLVLSRQEFDEMRRVDRHIAEVLEQAIHDRHRATQLAAS